MDIEKFENGHMDLMFDGYYQGYIARECKEELTVRCNNSGFQYMEKFEIIPRREFNGKSLIFYIWAEKGNEFRKALMRGGEGVENMSGILNSLENDVTSDEFMSKLGIHYKCESQKGIGICGDMDSIQGAC